MRYATGSIHLNQSQDYPLLRQILRSQFATQSHDMLNFVSGFFRRIARPAFFGLVSDWHVGLLDMPVLEPPANRHRPLRYLLR